MISRTVLLYETKVKKGPNTPVYVHNTNRYNFTLKIIGALKRSLELPDRYPVEFGGQILKLGSPISLHVLAHNYDRGNPFRRPSETPELEPITIIEDGRNPKFAVGELARRRVRDNMDQMGLRKVPGEFVMAGNDWTFGRTPSEEFIHLLRLQSKLKTHLSEDLEVFRVHIPSEPHTRLNGHATATFIASCKELKDLTIAGTARTQT